MKNWILKLLPIYDLIKIILGALVVYLPQGAPVDDINTVIMWIIALLLGADGGTRIVKKAVKGK